MAHLINIFLPQYLQEALLINPQFAPQFEYHIRSQGCN